MEGSMPKISLRAYNREIENLVDRGQTDQAIAHSKYILKQFPKHISTYRLLGKAYLESQRYTEAADIFQRVLAVLPDDFVAHLGMSIIREDEGDLDAAIWHMERAFEVQPSNNAVQGELRRLYGRRDGIEPPRVRLTRGALVRMYARGELYPQAIAEARAGLAEDPSRVDIETILARVYFLAGRKVEATEICSNLVTKLPYSLDANRILAEILPGTTRAEDAKSFQQAVIALEPYYAYVSQATPQSEDVPENAVMVEQLEYEGSQEEDQNPDWARTIGADLGEKEQAVPDWMNSIQSSTPDQQISAEPVHPASSQTTPPPPIPAEKSNEIPEWMSDAGWTPSAGDQTAESNLFENEEETPISEDIVPAEIPDWLKSLAPDEPLVETNTEDQERLASLAAILPKEEETSSSIETETALPHDVESAVNHPAESPAENLSSETGETPSPMEEDAGLPEWLNLDEDLINYGDTSNQTGTPSENENGMPPLGPQKEETVTGWLRGLGVQIDSNVPQPAAAVEPTQEEPEVVAQDKPAVEQTETGTGPASGNDLDAAMAWLDSLAAQQGADEELLSTPPDQRRVSPPEWLTEDGITLQSDEQPSEEIPQSAPTEDQDNSAEAAPTGEQEPSWDSQSTPVPELAPQEEAQPAQPIAETQDQKPESFDQPSDQDLDAAMNWLESLAARQGANEEELITSPQDRNEEPPEWIRREMETGSETPDNTPPVIPVQNLDQSDGSESILSSEEVSNSAETRPIEITSLYSEEAYNSSLEQTVPIHPLSEQEPPTDQGDIDFSWLSPTQPVASTSEDQEAQSSQSEKDSQAESGFPAWLNDIIVDQDENPDQTSPQPGEPTPEPSSDLNPSLPETETGVDQHHLPDWLKNLDPDEIVEETVVSIEPAAQAEPEITPIHSEEPVIPIAAQTEESSPEWLRDLEKVEPPSALPVDQPAVISLQSLETDLSSSNVQQESIEKTEPASEPVAQTASEPISGTPVVEPVEIPAITYGPTHGSPEFETARADLMNGKVEAALTVVNRMIEENQMLDEIISELRTALYRFPIDISLWQSLGDAYLHNNRIQDALDSYTKAEELLR
jgi:tetratricopeptide (TPR) repeat protein